MVRLPTLVLGATLGLAGLGVSSAASAGVHFAVGIGLPLPVVAAPVVVAPPVVAPAPVVAYPPVAYYGPHYYGYRAYPRVIAGWHAGYGYRGGYWHR